MPMSAAPLIRLIAASVLLSSSAAFASEFIGNVENGKALFIDNSCAACHGVTKADTAMVGPSLFGVVGRKAGTTPSLLGASRGLKEFGVIWNAETLDVFLADPDAQVPGTPMVGKLVDPQQRADVIAYLATLKD